MGIETKNSTVAMRLVCAILFWVFTFLYLYCYQAGILSVVQHLLSGGQTHYDRTVGAVLITALLFLLHVGVMSLTRLTRSFHALTYFPSLLALLLLTRVDFNAGPVYPLGQWAWLVPLLLVVCGACMFLGKQWGDNLGNLSDKGAFSNVLWSNVLIMVVMCFFLGWLGNGDKVLHQRIQMEQFLKAKDYRKAWQVGQRSLVTDSSQTMLRAYALSKDSLLGEHLFEYPLEGGSAALLPNGTSVKTLLYPEGLIYRQLGPRFKQPMSPLHYLQFVKSHGVGKPAVKDYLLCAYLLDGKLDAFAVAVGKYYALDQSLPKHYREALVLYTHLRSNPVVVFHDNVLDADFKDFQRLEKAHAGKSERRNALHDTYGNTYWYYYLYVLP